MEYVPMIQASAIEPATKKVYKIITVDLCLFINVHDWWGTGLEHRPLTTQSIPKIEIEQTHNTWSKFMPLLTNFIHKLLNSFKRSNNTTTSALRHKTLAQRKLIKFKS